MSSNIQNSVKLSKWLYILFWSQVLIQVVLPSLNGSFHLKENRFLSFLVPVESNESVELVDPAHFTLCCPGGGFAGFWFTLGRLSVLEEKGPIGFLSSASASDMNHVDRKRTNYTQETEAVSNETSKQIHYHCYSAGCVGVVSNLMKYSVNQVFDMALTSRKRWKNGEMNRFQIVEDFIDQMLMHNGHAKLSNSTLSRIHVVSTKLNLQSLNPFEAVSTTPNSIDELKTLLLQTSFIPFVTGDGLYYSTGDSTEKYVDGAFSIFQHDKCQARLDIPNQPKLLLNTWNMNLALEDAKSFWEMGLGFDEY